MARWFRDALRVAGPFGCRCPSSVPCSVSTPRSSNRTGAFNASKASAVSLPPLPLRLLPAGAKVAGRDLHPLKSAALARRTTGRGSHVSSIPSTDDDHRVLLPCPRPNRPDRDLDPLAEGVQTAQQSVDRLAVHLAAHVDTPSCRRVQPEHGPEQPDLHDSWVIHL